MARRMSRFGSAEPACGLFLVSPCVSFRTGSIIRNPKSGVKARVVRDTEVDASTESEGKPCVPSVPQRKPRGGRAWPAHEAATRAPARSAPDATAACGPACGAPTDGLRAGMRGAHRPAGRVWPFAQLAKMLSMRISRPFLAFTMLAASALSCAAQTTAQTPAPTPDVYRVK